MQKRRTILATLGAMIILVALAFGVRRLVLQGGQPSEIQSPTGTANLVLKRVVINEAARTLVYLPLYHAVEKGYFREAGLEPEIVTGGTATSSFASMLSGEADFALADPMYVPISREKGSQTKVVAQVVARVAFWGLANDPAIKEITATALMGKKIATHPQPMSGYTYTVALIRRLGLKPNEDVEVIGSQPGTELGPLFAGQVDFVLTAEPNVSKGVAQGAHIVFSYPQALGDQILSALMTRESQIIEHRALVLAVVSVIQRSLTDIHQNPSGALISAKSRFPQLDEDTLRRAVERLVSETVIPTSVLVSDDSWNAAIRVRVEAGDLRAPSSRDENCALSIMEDGSKTGKLVTSP